MAIDEKALLEKMQKSFGVDVDLSAIEEKHAKKRKEEPLLESLNNALTKLTIPELKQVEEVFTEPVQLVELIEEPIVEQPQMIVEIGRQPEPELPKDDIVTKSVLALSKPNQQDGSIQAVADKLPPGIQKELDIIKKSLADFHRFAQRHSQMGGGGEVNLRNLDDIDRSTIMQSHFLTYDNSKKKFVFAQIAEGNVDLSHIDQDLTPGANGVHNLGSPTDYWANVYVDSVYLDGGGIHANGSLGATNQILTSNGSTAYWSTPTPDRLVANGYEVILATSGQLNLPSANNSESNNARIQSSANIDILAELSLWTFGTDSVLTLPEHGKIIFNSANPEQYIEGTMGFHIHASDVVCIDVGPNTWSFGNDGKLSIPGNIIPQANLTYSLGNSTNRFESLWVGSNSVTFTDQVAGKADQTLTVANGVFYITDSLNTKQKSNAGFQVGNFLLQNNYISLTNAESTFYIGTTVATGNLVINRPIVVYATNTSSNPTFIVSRNGEVQLFTANVEANKQSLSIVGSLDSSSQSVGLAGRMIHVTGNDGAPSRIENDAFGTGAFASYIGRSGRGTANTPSATQNTDVIARFAALGWGATNFLATNIGSGPPINSIDFVATENYTDTSAGSKLSIYTSPIGSRVRTLSLTVDSNGITTNNVYADNITSYSNISGNSATFTSNVYIGNAGVATKLVISGGANDQILVSNGTTLNWTARHIDGTWTPVMIPATGSNVVFTVNNGKYVKAGPIVTAHFDIAVSSMGTASGALKLGGLPHTSLAGTAGNYEGTVSMGYFTNLNITDGIHFSGAVIQNSNTADIWLSTLNGQHIAQAPLNTTDVKVTSRFVGTVIYTTDF